LEHQQRREGPKKVDSAGRHAYRLVYQETKFPTRVLEAQVYTKHTKLSGFTLIELLVVVSIVALLVALVLPTLAKARDTALDVKCGSGARQVNMACLTYSQDYGQYYPTSFASGLAYPRTGNPPYAWTYQENLTRHGYATKDQFTSRAGCPYGPVAYSSANGSGWYTIQGTHLPPTVSYGMNSRMQSGWGSPDYFGPMRLDRLRAGRHPSMLGTIYDAGASGTDPYESRTPIIATQVLVNIPTSGIPNPVVRWRRHRETGLNFAHLDGNVRFVKREEIQRYVTGGAAAAREMGVTFMEVYRSFDSYWIDGRP
jgi:prepilin-type N-terminal cleavage/methylation domain-containing protein